MSKPPLPIAIRNPWILGPKRDLLFFIFTPLIIIPIIFALKGRVSPETLGIYVLGFGGFGHHLPGFIRAYADRDLFRQYALRFTLVPLLLVLVGGLYSFFNLNALACATVLWGTWHGAMQVNGFARIYDSKAGSFRPMTARLDWLMCLAWFGLAILHSPAKQFSLITQFYVSGGPLIPPWIFLGLRWIWDFSTLLITLLFLENARRQWRAGTPPNPIKFLILFSSFAFWWYCTASLTSLILGVLLWEIFHDVQYNTLVWMFQRRRVDGNLNAGFAEKFFFMPGPGRLALYSGLILAYGYIGVVTSFADINLPEKILLQGGVSQWLLRITLVSALLHFYYDGFIWRVRDRSIRQGLGLSEEKTPVPVPREKFLRHGWKWVFFLIPIGYLGLMQLRGLGPDTKSQVLNLSEALPGSWLAHFLAGAYHTEEGRMDLAETDYRMTVKYNPDLSMGHFFLANLLSKKGDDAEAIEQYRRSIELDFSDMLARKKLGFLYLKTGLPLPAADQFQAALAADPGDPELNFGMASALLRQRRLSEAESYAEKTLRLSPGHSGALNYLGMIQDFRGDLPGAVRYYEQALTADPKNSSARQNLIDALEKLKIPAG